MSTTSGKSFKEITDLTGTTLTYGFEVLSSDDIVVVGIDTTPATDVRTTLVKDTHYTLNTTTKTVTCAVASWAALSATYNVIRAYRVTTAAALVDFKSGGVLSESDLDTAYKQALFVAQEVSEDAAGTGASGIQSVGSGAIEEGAVTEGKIGSNAVTATKIADNAVVTAKIADDAVTAPKIADNAVITTTILNDAVTIDKIADNAVGTAQIVNNAVTHGKMATAALATKSEMEGETTAKLVVAELLAHHPGVAKAYGQVTFDTTSLAVLGGYNVASITEPVEDHRRITFTTAMANANYTVQLTHDIGTDAAYEPFVLNQTAAYFDIDSYYGDTTGYKFHFTVFGQLAS